MLPHVIYGWKLDCALSSGNKMTYDCPTTWPSMRDFEYTHTGMTWHHTCQHILINKVRGCFTTVMIYFMYMAFQVLSFMPYRNRAFRPRCACGTHHQQAVGIARHMQATVRAADALYSYKGKHQQFRCLELVRCREFEIWRV
eukprot:scaffold26010_cov34-Prasinocladus_malaysianus.AAC.1